MKSLFSFALTCFLTLPLLAQDGDGSVEVSGELKTWHAVTLTIDGPYAEETGGELNPFTEVVLNISFKHESDSYEYEVPGYFAADGNAAETSATSGTKWRAHLSPDAEGTWDYAVSLKTTDGKALPGDGARGRSSEERRVGKEGRSRWAPYH